MQSEDWKAGSNETGDYDSWKWSFGELGRWMKHEVINHQVQYVEGNKHTNTIEGFWSLLKKAFYGTHHHYTIEYTPLYIAERCYVYNNRHLDTIFWKFINGAVRL